MKLHSKFSLSYGIHSAPDLVRWCVENQHPYVLLTDINYTGSIPNFVKAAKQYGIHAIAGVELRNEFEMVATIIAENNEGYEEMNHFLSNYLHNKKAFPAILPHFENCHVAYPIDKYPENESDKVWVELHLNHLYSLPFKYKHIPKEKCLLLQPMTFLTKKDFNTHRLLRAIHNNTLLSRLEKSEQTLETEKLLPYSEIENQMEHHSDIWDRTKQVLTNCTIDFEFGEKASPKNPISFTDSVENDAKLLRKLSLDGVPYRYGELSDVVLNRINKELDIIEKKNYLCYFLITWDFTKYAREQGFYHVGRGSGANSIIAYLLRITDVDPIELDLYFERFINLYRTNPPDFDIDFSWKDRDTIANYLFQKYPHTAWIGTYTTYQYKAALRELGKVFGLPKNEIDKLAEDRYKPEQLDEISKLVIKYSTYIDGLPSNISVHSSGIVIAEKPIQQLTATFLPPKGFPTTQFSMLEAEDLGLFKFDVLSQRGLGKIKDCLDIIAYNQPNNPPKDIHAVNEFKVDPKIEELLLNTQALGCFYVESPAMRMLMKKLKVRTYLELVAASSIIRPGVSQSGMMREYILRHHQPERRKNVNPILWDLMPETYGVMVYQEDVIKVAHYFGGLTLGEADILRRGMSGKFRERSEFKKIKQKFFDNCDERKYDKDLTKEVWNQIESFASFAFAKGHSASYAIESYQSLYLKTYYPLEYLTATINNFGGYYRTEIYINEARKFGAIIEAPCIVEGDYLCKIYTNRIILGFIFLQGINQKEMKKLLRYKTKPEAELSYTSLLEENIISQEQIYILVKIGAFRRIYPNRKKILWQLQLMEKKEFNNQQIRIFKPETKKYKLPKLSEKKEELNFEYLEFLGFPLNDPFNYLKDKMQSSQNFSREFDSKINCEVLVYAYYVAMKRSKTKNGKYVYFGTFQDREGGMVDTVDFVGKHSMKLTRGVYNLRGIIRSEYGYLTLEIQSISRMIEIPDARYN